MGAEDLRTAVSLGRCQDQVRFSFAQIRLDSAGTGEGVTILGVVIECHSVFKKRPTPVVPVVLCLQAMASFFGLWPEADE